MTGTGRVVGVDSSTQSCKLVIVDAATGELVHTSALPHPEGTEVAPQRWWEAFEGVGATRLAGVDGIAVAAQQHSAVFLDAAGHVIRDAILWNDSRATPQSVRLRTERAPAWWAREVGVVPCATHPVSKLRWLAEVEPEHAARVRTVMLAHDWLTWTLRGGVRGAEPTTDRSDASSTGFWSVPAESYRSDLIRRALGRDVDVPRVLGPGEPAGTLTEGIVVAAGLGDNAATHLGLGSRRGEAVVSVGTSLTVSLTWSRPLGDATGGVDDMADATSRYLPIVVSLNGARTLSGAAKLLRVTLAELDALARHATADAAGVTFLPYLDGERDPARAGATGALLGLTRASMAPENIARAAILGMACTVADGIDNLERAGGRVDSVVMVGGGARSPALRQAVADVAGRVVEYPAPLEYAARGAARQAAWAVCGDLPEWVRPVAERRAPRRDRAWVDAVRSRHRDLTVRVVG